MLCENYKEAFWNQLQVKYFCIPSVTTRNLYLSVETSDFFATGEDGTRDAEPPKSKMEYLKNSNRWIKRVSTQY